MYYLPPTANLRGLRTEQSCYCRRRDMCRNKRDMAPNHTELCHPRPHSSSSLLVWCLAGICLANYCCIKDAPDFLARRLIYFYTKGRCKRDRKNLQEELLFNSVLRNWNNDCQSRTKLGCDRFHETFPVDMKMAIADLSISTGLFLRFLRQNLSKPVKYELEDFWQEILL